jgi:methyltransferase (TIGR00027 family)
MQKDNPSRTAQYMALFRAIETVRPSKKRLFNDPFAMIFLDNTLKLAVKISSIPFLRRLIFKIIQNKASGALSSGIARTKYIDDLLEQTISDDIKQLIILGAGFDTRSLRLNFLKDISIIEIDHPDTSNIKIKKLENTIGNLPSNVKYYQLDFKKQNLTDLAKEFNLNMDIPTIIIWEGVTNYLNQEAVNKTFEFIQKFSDKTYIIFTYIDKLVLDNPQAFQGTEQLFKNLKKNEEPYTFGIQPDKLSEYLNKFDLTLIENKSADEYRNKYMPERTSINKGYEFYRVAYAKQVNQEKTFETIIKFLISL